MKLLMLGYFGFGNAGDEAILAAEIEVLRSELGPSVEFTVVSGDPEHTGRVHGLEAVSRTDYRGLVAAIRDCDALVAGGGSLLQDVTSARPVAFYGGVMLLARMLRKPVFVYAQGLGPIRRRVNRLLAGLALRSATYVSLRDEESVALAEALGVRGAVLVPDPVLGRSLGIPGPGETLAVALRPWHDQESWLPEVVAALKAVGSDDTEIVLVAFHGAQDVELASEVCAAVGSGARVVSGDHETVLAAVAGARATLGMRLHALIAAAAAGRPFVALSYDPKVTAFARQVGRPVVATLPGPVDPEALAAEIRSALAMETERYAEYGRYTGRLSELRAHARGPAARIAEIVGSRHDLRRPG
ncbi:polysaccharide pyruvyl transferase family protein [Flindersiella endophytica]